MTNEQQFFLDVLKDYIHETKTKERKDIDWSALLRYANQNEWRIALYRGELSTDAYVLDVGDLSDIAVLFPTTELKREFRKNLETNVFAKGENCYFGNVSRREVKSLFYELGDNKTEMFMTL